MHILDKPEAVIQRYLKLTGKTRAELEAERDADREFIDLNKDQPAAKPDEKFGQYIGFDVEDGKTG